MIKILYDKINHSNDNSTLWKPDNISAYNKFTQNINYIEPVIQEKVQVENITLKPKKIQKKNYIKAIRCNYERI